MSGRTVLTYHPLYDGRGFSPVRRSWDRYSTFKRLLDDLGLRRRLDVVEPELGAPEDVSPIHPRSYVEHIQAQDRAGTGYLDGRETPAWTGVYARAMAAVGGTLEAARMVLAGEASHIFNPSGGLHHAHAERTSGFCIFNDVALAVHRLREGGLRHVAVVDVDGHHGDGTQELLYGEPSLTISLHQYDGRFFPGTGSAHEVGWGNGYGLNINVGLPRRVGDGAFCDAFHQIVPGALRRYRPDAIVLNFGVDGHYADPLVKLSLTTATYRRIAASIHELAHELCDGRLIVLGSGGYDPLHAARCWAVMIAALTDVLPSPNGAWPTCLTTLADEPLPPPEVDICEQARRMVDLVRGTVLPLQALA